MENNSGLFSGGSGMLGLEMSLNHQQPTNFLHHQPPFSTAPKQQQPPFSDEECNNPTTTDDSGGVAGDSKFRKGSTSPWQRMKWTDNMVRLLIMVVFYIGDEAVPDPPPDTAVRRKPSGAGAGAGGALQKKGKWKSVSKAMMERGFNVSPQQCEDKFNDLNKRYKRVNEILGKGTACKVVENQTLLESMDHIPIKLKEEAKKLLNSKHLFFREMCAYHTSCSTAGASGAGGSGGGAAATHQSPPSNEQLQLQLPHHRQKCVHSNDEEDEDEEEDEGEHGDEDEHGGGGRREEEEDGGGSSRKRVRMGGEGVMLLQEFESEVSGVIQDLTKSVREKREWMKMKKMELEEERVGFEGEGYELEKRRLRWVKFCSSREREMEIERLRNERMKLENERMGLLLREKELELLYVQE